jgi:hypothetical protein
MTLHLVKRLALGATALALPAFASRDDCTDIAKALLTSSQEAARADYWLALANCRNGDDSSCEAQAKADLKDALDLAQQQYDERVNVCKRLGGGPYDPQVSPDQFSTTIDNPYSPYTPGTTLVYEGDSIDGFVHNEVTTLKETATIAGFTVRAVEDVVLLDGVLSEDATDYFAQRADGGVWYMGEVSRSYADGFLDSLEGSWRTGKDNALPGIIMEGAPKVGDFYRQEYQAMNAEDVAEVIALDETVVIGMGTFDHCIQTLESSPLEPGSTEYKYYAPGIGMILDVDLETGDRLELVAIK